MVLESYDYWLLDLDGTLVDVEPAYTREVFDRVGDRLGYGFTDAKADALWHGYGGIRDDLLREWGIEPARFWSALHEAEDPVERAEASFLYDDAAVVGELERSVGLVTHCQPAFADPVLDALDIRDWFDAVVHCSDEIGWKPDPGPVTRAAAALDVPGDARGVLAGDGPHDVGAAWNAGLDGIHVERHGPDRRGLCVLADHRVESFTDLAP